MSNLVNWAKSELQLIGGSDDDMQQVVNKDILEVVEVFAKQGHSGFSASYTLGIIKRLLDWKPISPLTGADEEWGDVPEWDGGELCQQNNRCSAVFRHNFDNSTAYYIDGKVFSEDGGRSWFQKGGHGPGSSAVPATFPYNIPDKPEYIILPQAPDTTESA